jgi:hypothetical protein
MLERDFDDCDVVDGGCIDVSRWYDKKCTAMGEIGVLNVKTFTLSVT